MGIVQDIHDNLEKGAVRLVAEYRDRLCRNAAETRMATSGAGLFMVIWGDNVSNSFSRPTQ